MSELTLVGENDDIVNALRTSLYPGASDQSLAMVLSYCRAAQLDPLQKPVHIVPIYDGQAKQMRDVVMPGIGLYRIQAARSGEYGGITEPNFGADVTEDLGGTHITYPSTCTVTVKRILPGGITVEFTATERWKENYATKGRNSVEPNAMWAKRPYGQLAKCAEAQALRKAFPEFCNQPTADEMEGKDLGPVDVSPPPQEKPQELPLYPDELFQENLPKWGAVIESGKKTSADVIATVGSKYRLTDEQKEAIAHFDPVAEQ